MLAKTDDSLRHLRMITKKELRLLVRYTPQHILRLENDNKFPKRIKLGENRVVWRLVEIEEWLKKRIAERDARPGSSTTPAE